MFSIQGHGLDTPSSGGTFNETNGIKQQSQLARENQTLKEEIGKLKREVEKILTRKTSIDRENNRRIESNSNSDALHELEALRRQVGRIEKKASERKVVIKKLYSLLESREKEVEDNRKL